MLITTLIADIRRELIDDSANTDDARYWSTADLRTQIQNAVNTIVALIPTAGTAYTTFSCVAGSRQTLPTRTMELMDAVRVNGGRSIRMIDRELLDSEDPDWHTRAQTSSIIHVMYDKSNPREFWTYPPALVGTSLVLIVNERPADINYVDANAMFPLPDEYIVPAKYWVKAELYDKNSVRADFTKHKYYMSLFDAYAGKRIETLNAVASTVDG